MGASNTMKRAGFLMERFVVGDRITITGAPGRRDRAMLLRETCCMTLWIVGVAAGLTIAGVVAQAHHSIAGVYDSGREGTVDGVVTQFQFVSPHPFVDVRDGRTNQQWRLEMDNRGELEDIGFTAGTLKPGDRVVVIGSLARREANRMYIRRLDRPADGFGYEQVGNSPRLRARRR